MQRIKNQSKIIITILMILFGLTVAQVKAHETTTAAHSKSEFLTDKVIAPWYQKVQAHPWDDRIRVKLGDALMQRARETNDLRYYPLAKSAFQTALQLNSKNSAAMIGMA
ncbi:MAG: hypothetical protein PVH85_09925 [Desulfobacterales bacterium]|jgi:Flp pilus assembly protein TadD